MKKLIEALHVIQEECKKYNNCTECPMFVGFTMYSKKCAFDITAPDCMDIDEIQKALL